MSRMQPPAGARVTLHAPARSDHRYGTETSGSGETLVTTRSRAHAYSSAQPPILVLDDDPSLCEAIRMLLQSASFPAVHTFTDGEAALQQLAENEYSILLLDLAMPKISGQEVLKQVVTAHPDTVVIMLTGSSDPRHAVSCLKGGAYDYLVKPVTRDQLLSAVENGLHVYDSRRGFQERQRNVFSEQLQHPEAWEGVLSEDRDFIAALRYVETVAPSRRPLLITGETGTGKGLLARSLYEISRCSGPFVSVNVAGLDDSLFADTLFGHVRGAFTGADRERGGFVEQAARGVLFLDEMGDLSLTSQVKLLRLLEDGEYHRLGCDETLRSEARIVCATNRDLEAAVAEGAFREDLYYRLTTHTVKLPPLRERRIDIPILVRHFVVQAAEEFGKKPPPIPDDFYALLDSYDFPGNVRELESLIAEAVSAHRCGSLPVSRIRGLLLGGRRKLAARPAETDGVDGSSVHFPNPMPTMDEVTKSAILEALVRADGNKTTAAQLLGISRTTLNNRLRVS